MATLIPAIGTSADALHAELRTLIANSRQRVGKQLAQEFGRGFEAKNLQRMVQFAVAFPDTEIVATLSRHLSWTHFPRGGASGRGARLGT